MGTNYYFLIKKKDVAEKYFPFEYEITDFPDFGYRVHLGKCSYGWKPLFQEHRNAYQSAEGLMNFLISNNEDLIVFDEYGEILTEWELRKKLLEHGNVPKKEIDDPELGKISVPIDHVEYSSRTNTSKQYGIRYWHDEDGYDFTEREFS